VVFHNPKSGYTFALLFKLNLNKMNKFLVLFFCMTGITAYSQTHTKEDSLKIKELEAVSIIGGSSKKIAGSGEKIDAIALSKLNQPDINKVLRNVPGVNVRDEEGFGLRPNIGLRGTPVNRSAKITLMEDGVLIAPAPYADPSAYYFPTFARMQGIEVLKGSSQIKYGPYTIGGAINLISTAIPSSFKGLAQVNYGSFGTNQQRIWIGDSHKNIDYVFEAHRIASNGFKELDGGGNTGFDRRDFMGKVRWHSSADAKIQQSLMFKFVRSEEEGNETYLGLTFDDFKNNPLRRYAGTQKDILNMNHSHFTLNHIINLTKSLSISTTAYYSETFRDWARANSFGGQSITAILSDPVTNQTGFDIMTGQADGSIVYRSAARTYYSKGVQTSASQHFKTGKLVHKLQIGGRYHEDQADRYGTQSTYTMTSGVMGMTTAGIQGNQENQIRNAKSTAAYFNYEFTYKGFKFIPGLRYEYIEFEFLNYGTADFTRTGTNLKSAKNYLSVFLPGATASYDINSKMNTFVGVHKGFSPPGMPSVTSTTGQASEEVAINYELGYRYSNKGLEFQLVGFLSDYSNLLGSDNVSGGGAGTGDMFNAGNATIQGIEFSADYCIKPAKTKYPDLKIPVRVSYTFTDARFNETFVNGGGDWGTGTINERDFIPFITPHLAMVSLGIEGKKFNALFSGRYVGLTRTTPGQNDVILPLSNENFADVNAIAAYTIIDFSANYHFTKTWTVFTTINNLTNNRNIVSNLPQGYRPAMPIAVNLGVKINLY
jgi:Fe(3+) dicitrate transport protein